MAETAESSCWHEAGADAAVRRELEPEDAAGRAEHLDAPALGVAGELAGQFNRGEGQLPLVSKKKQQKKKKRIVPPVML